MSARAELRKGWCPGALRPMETGDGLLVRVRPRAGLFSIDALKTIAHIAARYGSGEIDLTNRANLQMRGLREESWREAVAELDAAGLIDADAGVEAVRNVVVDPLFGLDPGRADLRPIAAELERRLTVDVSLHALPNKFGFSVGDARADITISPHSLDRCALRLDGDDRCATVTSTADAVAAAVRVTKVFMTVGARRMRDAVAALGAAEIFERAGVSGVASRAAFERSPLVGILGPTDAPYAVGVGLPFARIGAAQLSSLCAIADCGDARPSPSRVLVFPAAAGNARSLMDAASALGLIVGDDDPRLAMDACPGAPACRNGTTDTRADAAEMARALAQSRDRPSIHISGCSKGCARRGAADLTIVANAGRYDIILSGGVEAPPLFSRVAPADLADAAARALAGRRP